MQSAPRRLSTLIASPPSLSWGGWEELDPLGSIKTEMGGIKRKGNKREGEKGDKPLWIP